MIRRDFPGFDADVAQQAEQPLRKRQVAGSSPAVGSSVSPLAPGQAESRLAKRDLDRWLAALQERREAPPAWLEFYDALLDERTEDGRRRWDWRKALFIAWSCVPRQQRQPRTLTELAGVLGLRPSSIRKWRSHDPEIVARISSGPREMLLDHVADVMQALVDVASMADPKAFQDRRLFLEITGNYHPSAALALDGRMDLEHGGQVDVVHDLSRLDEDQLRQLAAIAEALDAEG